jgi:ABC-type polysaccharide/polyol phosphate export permease
MLDVCRTLYRHRELIGVLVVRHLKLRYRGSTLGFVWTLLNPLVLMVVYTLVFSVYFRIDIESYPAFLFSGLLPWIWFASSLQQGVTSILDGAGLVTRSQFPAEVLPVVTATASAVNFALTLPLLLGFLIAFDRPLGLPLLFLPVLMAIEYLLVVGLALIAAAVNVFFRDLQHIILHLLTIMQFLTPVFYPVTLVPEPLRPIVFVNPLAVLIAAYHDVLYWNRLPNIPSLLGLLVVACVVLSLATAMFNRYKQTFAEAL